MFQTVLHEVWNAWLGLLELIFFYVVYTLSELRDSTQYFSATNLSLHDTEEFIAFKKKRLDKV
jgi:hypothetical protein